MHDEIIVIGNDGARITQTNYWDGGYARRGEFFASTNAGTVRLLVPPQHAGCLPDMQAAEQIVLTRGEYQGHQDCMEVLFDDGSDSPFCLWIGPHQYDRLWPDAQNGLLVPFVVYRGIGDTPLVSMAGLRRAKSLPSMKPWTEGA